MARLYVLIAFCALFMEYSGHTVFGCSTWVDVKPENYSKKYIKANDAAANTTRPFGYKSSTVTYGSTTKPCVIVQNTNGNGRYIELKLDMGSSKICVETNTNTDCYEDTQSSCIPTAGGQMEFRFYCESCEGSSVTFWYRFVLQPPKADGSFAENWCQTRSADYPSSLKTTDEGVKIPRPPSDDGGDNGALTSIRSGSPMFVLLLSCVVMFYFK